MRHASLRRLTAALFATAALVLANAAPAAAATSGCGWSCEGKDPATFRVWNSSTSYFYCADDKQTVAWATTGRPNDYTVQLRYSARCRTVWALSGSEVHFWVERQSPYGYADAYPVTGGGDVRTVMLNDAGYVSRACYDYPAGGVICSAWY
ncbi:DUF2690 domain-containing protein [Micromonospora sp. NPDC049836]|uniref:DUF2690 domain-containing protein n=1 Tax=unclassified Micromonospora TaxID=2617518 RepID=UPI0033E22E57